MNKKSIQKLIKSAYEKGIRQEEAHGKLHQYFTFLYKSRDQCATDICIYKNFVFIFKENVVITMFTLQGYYQKSVRNCFERRKKENGK